MSDLSYFEEDNSEKNFEFDEENVNDSDNDFEEYGVDEEEGLDD